MWFNIAIKTKIKTLFFIIFLNVFTGCNLFNPALKLDTVPLDVPPNAGYIMSPSSGYITVIDTKRDSVIGREQVARRDDNDVDEIINDFLIYKGLIFVTLNDRDPMNNESSGASVILRILDPALGEIEESKVGWAPNKIYYIGGNLAFISSNLIYYSNDSCYNYIYNLDTRKVVDTVSFKNGLVDFAVANGDTVIMDVKDDSGEHFVLYSKRNKSIIKRNIPTYSIYAYPGCAIINGDKLYVGGTDRVAEFSLTDLSHIKDIYLDNIGQYGDILSNFSVAHNKLYIVYVMDFSTNGKTRIDIIDMNSDKWIGSINIPEGGAECIDYSPSSDRLFVPAYDNKGEIYVIDPSSDSIVDTIGMPDTTAIYTIIHVSD